MFFVHVFDRVSIKKKDFLKFFVFSCHVVDMSLITAPHYFVNALDLSLNSSPVLNVQWLSKSSMDDLIK